MTEEHKKQKQRLYSKNWYQRKKQEDPQWYLDRLEKSRTRQRTFFAEKRKNKEWSKIDNARVRDYRAREPMRYAISHAKAKAKKVGIPFDLKFIDLTIPDTCPVLGMPLIMHKGGSAQASLDRIHPQKGYVKGNVKVISLRANMLKNDCIDPAELRAVADYIERCNSQITTED